MTDHGLEIASVQRMKRKEYEKELRRLQVELVSTQDSWPLRLAAVEAGKWGCGRPGRRSHCDAYELVTQDGAGDHRQELSIVA